MTGGLRLGIPLRLGGRGGRPSRFAFTSSRFALSPPPPEAPSPFPRGLWAQAATLYASGDFDGALSLTQRILAGLRAAASGEIPSPAAGLWADGLVNGVHMGVVALALRPAALECKRRPEAEAEAALEEALAWAEACGHPPTRCYALASLCRDYLRLTCDRAQGLELAAQAEGLAEKHGLAHCGRFCWP